MSKLLLLAMGCWLMPCAWAQSNTFTQETLTNFNGANGAVPVTNLIQASDGNFYGTTLQGGTHGYGTLFEETAAGVLTVVHNFTGPDGRYPYASLVEGADGCLYGTTTEGGALEQGTVFRVAPDGAFVTLHSFTGPDGNLPYSRLIQATDGNFYGTTAAGGASGMGFGTIFRMTPAGVVETIYSFTGMGDGEFPYNNLLQGSDGNLNGVTAKGGSETGAVFFQSTLDGSVQATQLLGTLSSIYFNFTSMDEDSSGYVYGTVGNGGATGNGEVFRISESGDVGDWFDFPSNGDGGIPYAGLLLGTDGNQYGSTYGYGSDGGLFSISSSGELDTLATFTSATGQLPLSSLLQGADGNFYGNTSAGGSAGDGTVFRLVARDPLPAPVQLTLSPASVAAGSSAQLSWQAINAYSDTLQQCDAFVNGNAAGAGNWTGLQHGELSGEYFSGSATIVPTEAGQYTYALTCGGVESGSATLTVTGTAKLGTTTAVAAPAIVTQGQSLTLTATVGHAPGKTPTGTVAFSYGGELLGQASVNGAGVASMTASSAGISAGHYLLTASYSGDANYAPSNSGATNVNLLAQTGIALTATPASIVSGAPATLVATVAQKYGNQLPTGVVTFLYGNQMLGQSSLIDGQTTWVQSTQGLAAGTYTVQAKYAGDAGDAASTSAPIVVTITP